MEINVREERRWIREWSIFRKLKSGRQTETGEWAGGWVGGWVTQHSGTGQKRPGQHLKSLLWVVPLTHPVYFISLFVILTHSWAQGKFVLLPLRSSLKNSTGTVFQVTPGSAYHLAPWRFSWRRNTRISFRITFFTCACSPSACSRRWPLFPFQAGQKTAFHKLVKIGEKNVKTLAELNTD